MPWLKYQHCYAHGYGPVEYIEFTADDQLDDLKYEIRNSYDSDRDGIREPKWEVLDELPIEVLREKVIEAESHFKSTQSHLTRLRLMLLQHGN